MAWNTITYACSHTEEQQLFGKMTERDRIVAAAAQRDCPACRAAKAQVADQAAGLPTLQGSEKQVAWASECRAKLLPLVDAEIARAKGLEARIDAGDFGANQPTAEKIAAARVEIATGLSKLAAIKANTKAGWWIDNRGSSIHALMRAV